MQSEKIIALDECRFSSGMGTINASGVIKNIRGSKLSVSEIFLREAVQNSYDARIRENGKTKTIDFIMRAYHFKTNQFDALIQLLDKEKNNNSFYRSYLAKNINREMLNIEISDSNTTGLYGLTEPTDKIEKQNFSDFVYSTGNKKPEGSNNGGTYGFGKAALYAYSQARCIVIYTRVLSSVNINNEKGYQSRFIIIANDERITETKSDRCWWGIKKERTNKEQGMYAAPVIGKDADLLAESLGMSVFRPEETGTKVLVLNAGPDVLPEDSYHNKITVDEIIKERMPYYIIHWYWNKIISDKIDFNIYYEDEHIVIENPKSLYPYSEFCKAYSRYLSNKKEKKLGKTKSFSPIASEHPKVNLGYVSISNTPVMRIKKRELFTVFTSDEPVIAYMRGIGHIVYYDKIRINSDHIEQTCYGVFRTDVNSAPIGEEKGSIDTYFTNIENQTHDRWEHRDEQFKRNYIKTVLREVEQLVRDNCTVIEEEQKSADISIIIQRSLGSKLMPFISNIGGAKASMPDSSTFQQKIQNKTSIIQTGKIYFDIENNKKICITEFKANITVGHKIKIKSITPRIKLLDSSEQIIDPNLISFVSYEGVMRDGTKIIYKKDSFEITSPLIFYIKTNCSIDCAFDIKIDWEEQDA